jgi:hypothetical protein
MSSDLRRDLAIGGALIASSFLLMPVLPAFLVAGIFSTGASIAARGIQREFLSDAAEGRKANITSNQDAMPVVYGLARVGMRIVDTRLVDDSNPFTLSADPDGLFSGANDNEVLGRVGAFCMASEDGSGVEDITEIRFYRDEADAIATPTKNAAITATGMSAPYTDHVKYLTRTGTDTQTVPNDLIDELGWSASMDGIGVAYAAFFLLYDADVWRGGIPAVTALVKGNKVYDPRSETWVWSDNPALCILDYLTSKKYGGGVFYPERDSGDVTLSEIDEQSFIDAANHCDIVGDVPGGEQKRFRCNGVVDTSRSVSDNLSALASCCRGETIYQAGLHRLVLRQAQTAESFELNEGNIIGDWEWTRLGASVPNKLDAVFLDERNGEYAAESVTWPLSGDTAFLTADNGIENKAQVELPFTSEYFQALQTVMVILREAREDIIVGVTCTEAALQLEVGNVVKLTHETPGWTEKEFYVASMALLPDGKIRLGLQEYDENAYLLDTFSARATVPSTNLPNPFTVLPPTALDLTSDSSTALLTQDGMRIPTILANWTASLDPFVHHYLVEFKPTADSVWQASSPVRKGTTSATITPVTDAVGYSVRVITVNHLGVRSDDSDSGANDTVTVGTVPGVDVANALDNFRETARNELNVTYSWSPGVDVATIWVYQELVQLPVAADPWPTAGDFTNLSSVLTAATTSLTLSLPPAGYTRYVQLEPTDATGVEGPYRRLLLLALAEDPDTIQTASVEVDDAAGSVKLRAEVGRLTLSARMKYIVGANPAWPDDAAVEAGTVDVVSNAAAEWTLPADTVPLGEMIRVRFAGYTNNDGTGYLSSATAHGNIVSAVDVRTQFRVPKLEVISETESGATGTMTVKVWDPDDLADNIYYRSKSGTGAWGAWTLKFEDPATTSQHVQTVTLQEAHASFIQFRLDYTLGGESGSDTVTSGGFDRGRIAGGSFHPSINEDDQTGTGWAIGDVDTTGWKLAAQTSGAVSAGTVDGEDTKTGRVLTPANIGNLVTGLSLGDTVYFGARAIGPQGNGPLINAQLEFLNIAPQISITTESESSTLGTLGVTVADPGGQADELEYRKKGGDAAWGSWTDAVGSEAPPVDGTEYTQTVTLIDNHLSFIQFRCKFTLRDEAQVTQVTSGGFDKGRTPGGSVTITVDGSRNVSAICMGDIDTAKWQIGGSKASAAAALTAADAATAIAGRVLPPTTVGTLLENVVFADTIYVAAIPIASDDTEGPASTASLYYGVAREPTFNILTETEDGSNGTFRVNLVDPDSTVIEDGVFSREKVGPAAWTAYLEEDPASGTEYQQLVGLVEGHLSHVEFRATYLIDGETFYATITSAGFDPGRIPSVRNVASSFDTQGNLRVEVNCDSDTDKFWIYVHLTAFQNATVTKTGTLVTGNQGGADFGPYNAGQDVYVTVVAHNNTDSVDSTSVTQHKDQAGEGDEQGNYVRGIPKWVRESVSSWSIEIDIEYGPDTDRILIEYTAPTGSDLLDGQDVTSLPSALTHTFKVRTSGGAIVTWDDTNTSPQVILTPKVDSPASTGTPKIYELQSPLTAAAGFSRLANQAGTLMLSEKIVTRAGYGVEVTDQAGVANLQIKAGDFVTVSTAGPSGTPNNTAEPALWIQVAS